VRALTVGHSTHAADEFVALLRGAGVEALADVRRFPGSRRHPHFGREALAGALGEAGIAYEHLPELGGRRSPVPASVNAGWQVAAFRGYADHLRSDEFATGRTRLEVMAAGRCAVVMCAEAQWWRCHRRLVADVLVMAGHEVAHLMPGGRLIEHAPPGFAVRGEDGLPLYPGQLELGA